MWQMWTDRISWPRRAVRGPSGRRTHPEPRPSDDRRDLRSGGAGRHAHAEAGRSPAHRRRHHLADRDPPRDRRPAGLTDYATIRNTRPKAERIAPRAGTWSATKATAARGFS